MHDSAHAAKPQQSSEHSKARAVPDIVVGSFGEFVQSAPTVLRLASLQRLAGNQVAQRMVPLGRGVVQRDAVDDALANKAKTPKERFSTVINGSPTPTFAQLSGFLDGVTQPERETISGDTTLMAKAKEKLAAPDYLSLLLALRLKKAGTVAHKSAEEADTLITTKLAAYTAGAVKAGRKVAGQVAVLDGADWDMAYEREFGDDGEQDTTNAFVDNERDRIFIHKDRGNPGTIIHEGMHKYSPNDFINEVKSPLNEGVTEYFTRKICDSLEPPVARDNYDDNFDFAKKFVDLMGEAMVAAAYFDGNVADLKKKFTDSGRDWVAFVAKVKAEDWSGAATLLAPVATPPTPVTPTK